LIYNRNPTNKHSKRAAQNIF